MSDDDDAVEVPRSVPPGEAAALVAAYVQNQYAELVAVAVAHLVDHEALRCCAVPVLQLAGPYAEMGRPAACHAEPAAPDGSVPEEPRLDTRLDPTQ